MIKIVNLYCHPDKTWFVMRELAEGRMCVKTGNYQIFAGTLLRLLLVNLGLH